MRNILYTKLVDNKLCQIKQVYAVNQQGNMRIFGPEHTWQYCETNLATLNETTQEIQMAFSTGELIQNASGRVSCL